MALQKTKTTLYGIDGNYWRIVQLNCNYDRIDAVCTIALYIDEAAYIAGNNHIDSFQVDLAIEFHNGSYTDGDDIMKSISLKEAYKALKKMATDESNKLEDDDTKRNDLAWFADASIVE